MIDWLYIVTGSIIGTLLVWAFKISHLSILGSSIKAPDTEYHLLLIDKIKKNKNNPFNIKDERFIVNPNFSYPYLLHWLLSFFKLTSVEFFQNKIQIFIKTNVTLLMSLMTGFVASKTIDGISGFSLFLSCFLGSILYGFSPVNRCIYWWAQYDYQLSPRSVGMLLTIAVEASILLYVHYDHHVWTALIVIFICLTCLSSRFALQAQFLLLIGLCTLLGSVYSLGIFTLGIILAIAVTNGNYFQLLLTHFRHFHVYATRTTFQHPDARLINPLTSNSIPLIFKYLKKGYFRELFDLLQRDVILRPIAFFPLHISCIVLTISNYGYVCNNNLLKYCFVIWVIMWSVCFLTSFKYTKFLGEADRYVEFGAIFPAIILTVCVGLQNYNNLIILTTSISLFTGWYFFLSEYQPKVSYNEDPNEVDLYNHLSRINTNNAVIACIPMYKSRPLASKLGFRIMCYLSQLTVQKYDDVIKSYPLLRLEKNILIKYGVTHVLVYKWLLDDPYVIEHTSSLELLYENPIACLYRFPH
ncbi:MAG: hypothetical protein HOI70_10550 [Opitutae bacterium]|jgi:hypothetical protein|nr:hypothetical protein [Opitutae bacterium]